jgi:hypothetical protein
VQGGNRGSSDSEGGCFVEFDHPLDEWEFLFDFADLVNGKGLFDVFEGKENSHRSFLRQLLAPLLLQLLQDVGQQGVGSNGALKLLDHGDEDLVEGGLDSEAELALVGLALLPYFAFHAIELVLRQQQQEVEVAEGLSLG